MTNMSSTEEIRMDILDVPGLLVVFTTEPGQNDLFSEKFAL